MRTAFALLVGFASGCGQTAESVPELTPVLVSVNWNAPHPERGFAPRSFVVAVAGCAGVAQTAHAFAAGEVGILNLPSSARGCRVLPVKVTYADAKRNTRVYASSGALPATVRAGGAITLTQVEPRALAADPAADPASVSVATRVVVHLGGVLTSPLGDQSAVAFGVSPVAQARLAAGASHVGTFAGAIAKRVPLVPSALEPSDNGEPAGSRGFFVSLSCEEALTSTVCADMPLLDLRLRLLPDDGQTFDAAAARELFTTPGDARRPTVAHYSGNGLRMVLSAQEADRYLLALKRDDAVRLFRFTVP